MTRSKEESLNQSPAQNGIPDEWFKTLGKANSTYPQSTSLIDIAVARTFFSHITYGEITPQQAFTSQLNSEQQARLLTKAGRFHRRFNINPFSELTSVLEEDDMKIVWTRRIQGFAQLAKNSLNEDNLTNNRVRLTDPMTGNFDLQLASLVAEEVTPLFTDPRHQSKVQVILEFSRVSGDALNLPSSQLAADIHRRTASEELARREAMDGDNDFIPLSSGRDLLPVFENVKHAVDQKAVELEKEENIIVPEPIKAWFTRGRDTAIAYQTK